MKVKDALDRPRWKVDPSVIGDVWRRAKKLQVVWSSPVKKFKSRLRDVRALWEKGVWQFEEKVADKQERMGMEGRILEPVKSQGIHLKSCGLSKTMWANWILEDWEGFSFLPKNCHQPTKLTQSDFFEKLRRRKQWAGRKGIWTTKQLSKRRPEGENRSLPQVIEYSPRVKMIEWILLTLIASAKGEFKSDGGLALLHSSYLF